MTEGNNAAEPAPTDVTTAAANEPSFIDEIRAAAEAASSHAKNVAATASSEAKLSVTSVAALAAGALLSFSILIVAWLCLLALGAWLLIQAGLSVALALTATVLTNLAIIALLGLWMWRTSKNIGFSRTRRLIGGDEGDADR